MSCDPVPEVGLGSNIVTAYTQGRWIFNDYTGPETHLATLRIRSTLPRRRHVVDCNFYLFDVLNVCFICQFMYFCYCCCSLVFI